MWVCIYPEKRVRNEVGVCRCWCSSTGSSRQDGDWAGGWCQWDFWVWGRGTSQAGLPKNIPCWHLGFLGSKSKMRSGIEPKNFLYGSDRTTLKPCKIYWGFEFQKWSYLWEFKLHFPPWLSLSIPYDCIQWYFHDIFSEPTPKICCYSSLLLLFWKRLNLRCYGSLGKRGKKNKK